MWAHGHRRLIGRRFDDPSVKKDVQSWPFKVIDREGNPYIEVDYLGETKQFSPQEISSMVLTKVCEGLALWAKSFGIVLICLVTSR